MREKKIPKKNYAILTLIAILTVLGSLYLASWYNATKEYYMNNSIMTDFLSEINPEEIDSYIMDNPVAVIYLASSKNTDIRSFEKSFRKLINEEEIEDSIIYMDTYKITDNNFYSSLKNSYFSDELKSSNISLSANPNIIVIEDRKIVDILSKQDDTIELRNAKNLLIKYGIINND